MVGVVVHLRALLYLIASAAACSDAEPDNCTPGVSSVPLYGLCAREDDCQEGTCRKGFCAESCLSTSDCSSPGECSGGACVYYCASGCPVVGDLALECRDVACWAPPCDAR